MLYGYFQFSLWDSLHKVTTKMPKWLTFNSLYEIPYYTSIFHQKTLLSILFMRFLFQVVKTTYNNPNFQFSLWDSRLKLEHWNYAFNLSILFMRFQKVEVRNRMNIFTFNSLYEIQFLSYTHRNKYGNFQFSLWDSLVICLNKFWTF